MSKKQIVTRPDEALNPKNQYKWQPERLPCSLEWPQGLIQHSIAALKTGSMWLSRDLGLNGQNLRKIRGESSYLRFLQIVLSQHCRNFNAATRSGASLFALVVFLTGAFSSHQIQAADFNREPDAIINTSSLFDLPKDVVAAPILKDLLSEEFVFYYRDGGADWLSFRGALARIAFEHQVDWPTRLMTWILNGPAEVALWKGDDGKLNHFMLVIDQTGVKEIAQLIGKAAAKDSQVKTDESTGRKIHALTLATGRIIYLAAEENRLFVFTSAAMKPPSQASNRTFLERAKAFFGLNSDVSIYGTSLGSARHSITFSAQYLSFGYQAFFSALKAVRFEFSKKEGWSTQILATEGMQAVDGADWSQMPKGAGFCLTVPLDTKKLATVVQADRWLQKSKGSAVACWYPESKLYTPVIAMRGDFKELIEKPNELKEIFTDSIGVQEAIWVTKKSNNEDDPPESKLKYLPMLPVTTSKMDSGSIGFVREIGGRFGNYPASESANPKLLGSRRFFRVKIVATSDQVVFSPDDQLVDRTLNTIKGKFPSMATSLPSGGKTATFVVVPEDLAKLTKSSILDSLPDSQESIFRTAVSRHLFPSLEKFAKRPTQAATINGSGAWKKVDWTSTNVGQ